MVLTLDEEESPANERLVLVDDEALTMDNDDEFLVCVNDDMVKLLLLPSI